MEIVDDSSPSATISPHRHKINKPHIAIVGAGYGGLTLANILHINDIPYTIFESKHPPFTYITGGSEFNVPSLHLVLSALQLEKKLSINNGSPLSREGIITILWERVKDNIVCGQQVTNLEKRNDSESFYIHHAAITNAYSKNGLHSTMSGQYDCVVGADGVLSKCRTTALTGTYLVGDARWVNDRWYDFGFRRINQGADLAMLDAVELGKDIASLVETRDEFQMLLKEGIKKKFCANEIWIDKTRRKVICLSIFFAVVARVLYSWSRSFFPY
jgi:2-polyprenyl-6-methoxyphenol hydroxylase-like FAD-dependent oxidoreductase